MTLPVWLEPANARITIPVVLAVGYAIYHWIRWQKGKQAEDTESTPSSSSSPSPSPQPSPSSSPPPSPSSSPPPSSSPSSQPSLSPNPEAERLWKEAREMFHREVSDISTDWRYMNALYKAAELGHLEAMSKLGDYAYLREEQVEAFYWKLKVEFAGGICRNPSLNDIVGAWLEAGCPEDTEGLKAGFGEEQSSFAYAALCYRGGVDSETASITLNQLAKAGNPDAIRFLRRR